MVKPVQVERSLTQGTLTFLFTDIEGSTTLLEQLGQGAYAQALAVHRELLLRAVNGSGGVEVDSQGDSLFAVFGSAAGAIGAAVSAQRNLASHRWPAATELRVRIGLHTGEAAMAEQGYVGMAVHRARRVCEAGHGGQIVVSSTTHAIVAGDLPTGVRMEDLGEVRLPGFREPERLFGIVAEGLLETTTDLRAARPWSEERGPLLERAAELAALDKAFDATRSARGRLVVIEGQPGVGKTSLLSAGRERAAGSGLSVLNARGSELESTFSFGVIRQLFEPAITRAHSDEDSTFLEGAAAHADRLFRDDPENAHANEDVAFSLLHGLYWLTLNLAESQPLVIAIDDLQWADAPTLRWLSYLARRIEGLAVCVVATARPLEHEDPLLAELLVDPATTLLRPNVLSAAAVAELVRAELAAEADDAFCEACYRTTGGNPLLLRELVRTLVAGDVAPVAASVASVERVAPDAIRRSVMLRLSRLTPVAGRLARAVAILGDGADRDRVAALAGLERREVAPAAAALARVDLLRQGPPLAFVHPVVRNAVYEWIPADERESEHARAAEILIADDAAPAQVAAQVLLAPAGSADGAVGIFRAAAQRAASEGGLESAAGYLSRALDEPVPDDERAAMLLQLAEIELDLGRAGVVDRLREAVDLIHDPESLAEARLRLGRALYWAGREEDGVSTLEGALAEWTQAGDLRRRLQAELVANATRLAGRFEEARRLLESLELEADEGPGARMLLTLQTYHEAAKGGDRERVVDLTLRSFTAMSDDERRWRFVGPCYTFLVSDYLEEPVRILDALIALARQDGAAFNFAGLSIMRAAFHYACGSLFEAEADARSALDAIPHRQMSWVPHAYGWLAQTLVERDAVDEATAVVDEGERGISREADSFSRAPLLRARSVIATARGDHQAAREAAFALGESLEAHGHSNPAFSYPSWRSLAAKAHFALGDIDEALGLARGDVTQARSWGAPRTLGRSLRILGSIEGGDEGLEHIGEAVDILQQSPAQLERAYALADLGGALRRANQRAEARKSLGQALEMARRCGATWLAERAHEELVAAGARPRRSAVTGVDALTPSERRIADMAAGGLSNRDIAQALFVTLRTVEMHLSNAFRKLDISGRTQLRGALAPPAEAPASTPTG